MRKVSKRRMTVRKRKNKMSERRMMLNLTLMMNLWICQPALTGSAEPETGTSAAGGSVDRYSKCGSFTGSECILKLESLSPMGLQKCVLFPCV